MRYRRSQSARPLRRIRPRSSDSLIYSHCCWCSTILPARSGFVRRCESEPKQSLTSCRTAMSIDSGATTPGSASATRSNPSAISNRFPALMSSTCTHAAKVRTVIQRGKRITDPSVPLVWNRRSRQPRLSEPLGALEPTCLVALAVICLVVAATATSPWQTDRCRPRSAPPTYRCSGRSPDWRMATEPHMATA